MAEEDVLVLLEPLLRLDAALAQVDQVAEENEQAKHDDGRGSQLEAHLVGAIHVGGVAELHGYAVFYPIENSVEGESRQGTLAEADILSAIHEGAWGLLEAEHAQRHRLRVIDVGQEHVRRGVQIELVVLIGHLEVNLGHRVIITVVTIAGVSVRETWVAHVFRLHLIAGVGWHHECFHEKSPVEARQGRLAVPSVDDERLRLQLLLDRWDVVRHFLHQGSTLVIDKRWRKVCVFGALHDDSLTEHAAVRPIEAII
mmetsp:Transcript_13012/g.15489  ORF Transcript_13012/g.15489 Transcript_13012/m.15489 type:complete len:256 (-) Transcript_13012:663-1430(-)